MFNSQAISFCATSQLSFYYGLYNNHNNNIYNLKVNRIKCDQPYLKMFQAASDFKTSPYGILILSPHFGGGGGGGGGGDGGGDGGRYGHSLSGSLVPLLSSRKLPLEIAIATAPKASKPPITPDCLPVEALDRTKLVSEAYLNALSASASRFAFSLPFLYLS